MAVSSIGGAASTAVEASALLEVPNQNYLAVAIDPQDSESSIQLDTDGDVNEIRNASNIKRDDWLKDGFNTALYEVRYTYLSGSADVGVTPGVWWKLDAARKTGVTQTTPGGPNTAQVQVDVRRAAAPSDAIQFLADLSATVEL